MTYYKHTVQNEVISAPLPVGGAGEQCKVWQAAEFLCSKYVSLGALPGVLSRSEYSWIRVALAEAEAETDREEDQRVPG